MTRIFLGLGSNIEPAHYLPIALGELRALFGELRCSAVYEGAAMGFRGDPFWNLVVSARTALPVGALQRALRAIEYAHGRPRGCGADTTRFQNGSPRNPMAAPS
jgi:2-amino-4-hydroxy-6-hydroxymethyldihydropteridine diphosphokinase